MSIKDLVYEVLQHSIPNKPISDDMVLLGGELDSMGLLTVVVGIEEKIQDQGKTIRIVSDHAMSQTKSPFKDVAALVEYVEELVK